MILKSSEVLALSVRTDPWGPSLVMVDLSDRSANLSWLSPLVRMGPWMTVKTSYGLDTTPGESS